MIERRQQQVFCKSIQCGEMIDRDGNFTKYDPIKSSSRPFYESLPFNN